MKRKHISTMLTLALSLGAPLTPGLARAQAPQAGQSVDSGSSVDSTRPTRVRIQVDAQAIGDRGLGLEGAVTKQLRASFEAGGVELLDPLEPEQSGESGEPRESGESGQPDGTDAALIRIRIGGKAENVQLFDYLLYFDRIQGNTATQLIEPVVCKECFDHALYDALVAQVPAVLDALGPAPSASAGASNPSEVAITPPRSTPPKPLGPLGGAGIGVAALGLGAIIWGAVDLSRGRVYDQDPSALMFERSWTDYGPRGQAWLGVGVASFAVGGALLITDILLRSKRRKHHGQQAGTLVPLGSARNPGLSWVRRF